MTRKPSPTTQSTHRSHGTRYVIFDIDRPNVVHTKLDCEDHVGLVELADQWYGGPCLDPEIVEEVAFRHGLLVPAELVERGTPCEYCTLVAAPYWRAAA